MPKLDLKKIRELLLFDEIINGRLLAYQEPGIEQIIFCLYENDVLKNITSYEKLTPIRSGDYLIVYSPDGTSIDREFLVDFNYKEKGNEIVNSLEFYSWFIEGYERKAKIIRKRF